MSVASCEGSRASERERRIAAVPAPEQSRTGVGLAARSGNQVWPTPGVGGTAVLHGRHGGGDIEHDRTGYCPHTDRGRGDRHLVARHLANADTAGCDHAQAGHHGGHRRSGRVSTTADWNP
ncbi:hypothetical protein ACFXGA_09810, partial [Actinosynnema sp. NPDC059335]|uniref:hypothetical protein n=1 Tax=Actinosynnema sp. NPDC059335 TaxID=3346804 RepID=UPI00366AE454